MVRVKESILEINANIVAVLLLEPRVDLQYNFDTICNVDGF
jgi:hypothetical protein